MADGLFTDKVKSLFGAEYGSIRLYLVSATSGIFFKPVPGAKNGEKLIEAGYVFENEKSGRLVTSHLETEGAHDEPIRASRILTVSVERASGDLMIDFIIGDERPGLSLTLLRYFYSKEKNTLKFSEEFKNKSNLILEGFYEDKISASGIWSKTTPLV